MASADSLVGARTGWCVEERYGLDVVLKLDESAEEAEACRYLSVKRAVNICHKNASKCTKKKGKIKIGKWGKYAVNK